MTPETRPTTAEQIPRRDAERVIGFRASVEYIAVIDAIAHRLGYASRAALLEQLVRDALSNPELLMTAP